MTEYPINEDIICEAIVREISLASRWCAVEEAWRALLKVRQMGHELRAEHEHLNPNSGTKSKAQEGSEQRPWDGIEHKHLDD